MVIRRVHTIEACLELINLFDSYRVFYKQQSDPGLAEQFLAARLQNKESVIFVASISEGDGEKAVGFTQLYPKYSSARATKNWILNDLYVESGYRGRGIAQQLINVAMDFAQQQGAHFVQLETGVDNHRAQKLYEFVGFVQQAPENDFLMYRKHVS